MATSVSSQVSQKSKTSASQLSGRLTSCWSTEINWDLFPQILREGCEQAGKAISMPSSAVLYGLLIVVSYAMSHSVVEVSGTDWVEPVILWIYICMPTGSGKSSLCKFLRELVGDTRKAVGSGPDTPSWFCDDQSFEKMGALMHANNGKLLGLYDELAMFLSQINVLRGKGLAETHELAVFLQLYGGNSWFRKTGDANFEMIRTGLTLGGFIQPNPARNMLEQVANVEKGLVQRFLWCIPQPKSGTFDELEKIDRDFTASVVCLMRTLWNDDKSVKVWQLPRSCNEFRCKYDHLQKQLQSITCMDELLSGMLSKSKGQILRIASVLHVLFHIETPLDISPVISEKAVEAAINMADISIQHAAYLAGRGDVDDLIQELTQESLQTTPTSDMSEAHKNAATCLLLPGKVLHLNVLLAMRKFRNSGNKQGALQGFALLENSRLGKVHSKKLNRGANMLYEFEKVTVPDSGEDRMALAENLVKFGASIVQYEKAYSLDDITMYEMMMDCWKQNSRNRPKFTELVERLSVALERESGYLKLSDGINLKSSSGEQNSSQHSAQDTN